MHINTYSRFIMSVLLAVFLCAGCSDKSKDEAAPIQINPEKDVHELYKKVVKERERTAARAGQQSQENEALRGKQMDAAEACLKQYSACLEKCSNTSCEDACLTALSTCEKDLPQSMKTVKEK
jgi:hypothetical protein